MLHACSQLKTTHQFGSGSPDIPVYGLSFSCELLAMLATLRDTISRFREYTSNPPWSVPLWPFSLWPAPFRPSAFDRTAPVQTRVIVYGRHSGDWMAALQPEASLWCGLPQIAEVLHLDGTEQELPPPIPGVRDVVLPLMEPHISSCRSSWVGLRPSNHALRTLSNKAMFARYIQMHSLGRFVPNTFDFPEDASYPCVLKRVDLNCSNGIARVNSREELETLLTQEPWNDHPYILQSYIEGEREFVAHCICKDGEIFWNCCYQYNSPAMDARIPSTRPIQKVSGSLSHLKAFSSILSPLRYSGPCCIDYRLSPAGEPIVFEINPRFGGSLMRPHNLEDLREAVAWILRLAS